MDLATRETELAKVKELEEVALRERKRLDMQLELERECELAKIRTEERANGFTELAKVLEGLKEMLATDYTGVHTLVTGSADSRDHVTGLLLSVLGNLAGDPAIAGATSRTQQPARGA